MKDKEDNKTLDWIIKIVLIIIIIFLLIHNCVLRKKGSDYANHPEPDGNSPVIEIICNKNSCKPVSKEIESLDFTQNNYSIKKGETINLIVNITPSELALSKFDWMSSDSNIVSVDSDGLIKGVNLGKATITVTSSNGKIATCIVEVVPDTIDVKKIKLTPVKPVITEGFVTQVIARIEPTNATNRDLVWTSSDSKIAKVNSKGVVTGIKKGVVTITAKTKDGKVVGKTTITVNSKAPEIQSLRFAQDNISIRKGNTLGLTPIVTPSELASSKFTWKSSDSSIVTVDSNGIIKGVNVGTATITVTSSNGKKATCIVNVTEEDIDVQEIILTPIDPTIGKGKTTQVVAEIRPVNATNRELVWSSSNQEIATVDSNGVVKGVSRGVVTITAKTTDGRVVASTTITIDNNETDTFDVYDDDHTPVTWNGATDAKIFGTSGKIAPESADIYKFVVKNGTRYNLKYKISLIETNPYNINMKYRLKKNDTYLIDHYVSANEVNVSEILLNSNATDTYYLEWKWVSSDNDTQIGKTLNANYGLKIKVEAESTNG